MSSDRRRRIRPVRPDDADAVQRVYAPYVTGSVVSFELVPPSAEEMARRIAGTVPKHPWLVVEEDDRVIGYAYAHPFATRAAYAWSVETSIYLEASARGRGIGTRLYDALLRILVLQGYRQAFAGVTLPNPASVALHEQMGYRRIATHSDVGWKFGDWHDVGFWQRPLGTGRHPPRATVPVDELAPELLRSALDGDETRDSGTWPVEPGAT
jgi:L-amino acid N-acyltransferase YncA